MIQEQELPTPGPCAVLQISPHLVEWYEHDAKGAVRYHGVVPDGVGAEALASAAAEARQAAGGGARPCVLMLERGLVEERSLQLPELKRNDLAGVLERKAAALFSGEPVGADQVLFHAQENATDDPDALHEWNVVALNGAVLRRLRVLLRQRRFNVRRIVAGHLAALAAGQATGSDPAEPFLSVVVRDDGVHLNLVHGNAILSRSYLEGNPSTSASIAAGLVHEIRSTASFWKRANRGVKLSRVVVMGMLHERGYLLATAIEAALVDAEIHLVPGRADSEANPLVGRFAILRSAWVQSEISPDLSFSIPPSRSRVAAVIGLCLLVAGAAGWHLDGLVDGELDELRVGIAELSTRTDELSPVAVRYDQAVARAIDLETLVGRVAAIGSSGVPLRDVLQESLTAFVGRAELRSARLSPTDDGRFELRIDGRVRGSTAIALERLRALRDRMRQSAAFHDVRLDLGDRLPASSDGELMFAITAFGDAEIIEVVG